jgi:hypothetical protein
MKKIDGNKKITLTLGQLKRLVKESEYSEWDFDDTFDIRNGVLVKYNGEDGDVVIPNGVTSIEEEVFAGHTGLTSVTIPNSVKEIGVHAFDRCYNLKSVTIPDSVKSIGWGAFEDCENLTSVFIPSGVTSIESSLCEGCTNLKSVTIPDSVTEIGVQAFYCCTKLRRLTIPSSVMEIGDEVVCGCDALETIYVANEKQKRMLLNGKNDFNPSVKIIVKGEDSDDKFNESRKTTLTLRQLKRLVRENA